ncbi:MAG: DUF4118 domain-containing protein [Lachnospiraceae bacterium]|nr:DUF4118 domain-containing protein [Lachnospiraceae bacterium]
MDEHTKKGERILVCISPSPSNPKVIMAAVKMAEAFKAALTALYVRPLNYEEFSKEDKRRLEANIDFAGENGASIATITGNDVPVLVAEYAHISGTTKLVVGRSGVGRRHFWSKATLTEQIILNAPDVDVYIIPDSAADIRQQNKRFVPADRFRPTLKESLLTLLLLASASAIGMVFTLFGFSKANIITVFILGVLVISVLTVSPLYSAAGSLASVLLFNWLFIEPRFSFHTYETEYAVTFAIMFVSSLITGTLANMMKKNARQAARESFRAKVLFDTNQLLQKAETMDDVFRITGSQIITLLDRNAVIYPRAEGEGLGTGRVFQTADSLTETELADADEREIAEWVFASRQAAGLHMERRREAKAQYHAICLNDYCYGVIVLRLNGVALETFENSVFTAILGECVLALESLRNAAEREEASLMARNEQLRSNLLRSISHDIRTPLTSISGNASNLLSHYKQMDDETLQQIFSDIYDDSEWLVNLVENLLSISRVEKGQMKLHLSMEVMNDVIEEALKHVDRNAKDHHITVRGSEDILLVRMETRLIMQVLINLINNAVKNTQTGSEICIRSEKRGNAVKVSVLDNGPGIPDAVKPHIFEMFYTGQDDVADGRRGLGLGLALCKSIIEAHKGTIALSDNLPTGCCFSFTLPMEEVAINE